MMVNVEGKGEVAPARVRETLTMREIKQETGDGGPHRRSELTTQAWKKIKGDQ